MSETQVTTEVQFENTDDLDAFASGFFGQKQPETTETKVEVEQDNETQTSEETEAQVNDEQDEAELQQEVVETPKRKTVQDRIDEVVRQREDIRREGQNQVAELLKRIEQLEKGTKPEVQNQSTEQLVDPNEPKPDALKEDGSPVYALGEFDPQYIRDLTRHTLQQERQRMEVENAQAQRQAAVQQEQQALTNQWNTKLADAVKEYPDLEEKGRAMLSQFDNLDPNYAGYLTQVLMSMDKGPDVLYYLSNHPDEAQTIVNSGAQRATLALGRIESRFLQGEKEAPKPKITKAPEPPRQQARGTNGAYVANPDTDDLGAFEKQFFTKARYG